MTRIKFHGNIFFYYLTIGDSFSYHNGVGFSTIDSDNDKSPDNCARSFEGGWWYNSCHRSNLNGLYLNGPNDLPSKGVTWFSWKGHSYSLKRTTMMIRKRWKLFTEICCHLHWKIESVKLVVIYDVIVDLIIVTSQITTNFLLQLFCEKGFWTIKQSILFFLYAFGYVLPFPFLLKQEDLW